MSTLLDKYFTSFSEDVSYIELPQKFTFPFNYEPHPLSVLAAKELQRKLVQANSDSEIYGKMYGIMVVKNQSHQIGYLAAFSGQVEHTNHQINFVPPIHDRLTDDGFFLKGEDELSRMNQQIRDLENNPKYLDLIEKLQSETLKVHTWIEQKKIKNQKNKELRRLTRDQSAHLSTRDFAVLTQKLENESIDDHYTLKKLKASFKSDLNKVKTEIHDYESAIEELKTSRKQKSAALQQQLFDEYQFLNATKETKSLSELFKHLPQPPAGAGDCAAPKLLQFAYFNNLKPIAMAEFWWGKPPKSELRKQGNFYPACSSKCKPILSHMLTGLHLDPDPMKGTTEHLAMEILFEDEAIIIINKPSGLLSVPSKHNPDAVFTRFKKLYPQLDGPIVAHRLDRHTSGLMIIVKSEAIFKIIQAQFIQRSVTKKYIAVLSGNISGDSGKINLPLTVDENDRPRQKVCYKSGKEAITGWRVLERFNGKTKIEFIPKTGRTHQLRVHAAHPEGLNTPIFGDKLYGQKADRLYLHAGYLEFDHPLTNKRMKFSIESSF